jgi:hypothetical protein
MPAGRPTDYGDEVVDLICSRLAIGESLNRICKDADMPAMSTVFGWLSKHPEFLEKYTRAREAQAESHADQLVEIADNPDIDANHKRIMVDARKWVASKLKPKRYGDKLDLDHSGNVGLTVTVKRLTDA